MEQDLKYNYYKKLDAKSMINSLKTECLTLNYQLERLVSDNDSHRILHPKKTLTVEVLANTYMYFKVVTKDMLSPGKINFAYAEGTYVRNIRQHTFTNTTKTKVELTVYFSTDEKNKEPSKENNVKFVESPLGTFLLPIVGKDRFENNECYISLYSLTGCTVDMTVTFPELFIKSQHRRVAKDDLTDESEFANFTVVKNWAAMKEKLALENKTNFLKDHVRAVGEYGIIQKERMSLNKEMRFNLLERAQIKRQ
jgi:hypothetical protein